MITARRTRDNKRRARPWEKRRRRWLILVIIPVLAGLAFGGFRLRLERQVAERIEAIRAAGHPSTRAEVQAELDKYAGDEAAALRYRTALKAFPRFDPPREEGLPIVGRYQAESYADPYPAEVAALVDEFLEVNAEGLSLLREAVKAGPPPLRIDTKHGYVHFPDGGPMHYPPSVLGLAAVRAAERGDTAAAAAALLEALAITRPVIMESLLGHVSMNSLECVTRPLKHVLSRAALPDAALTPLREAVAGADPAEGVERTLSQRRALSLGSYEAHYRLDTSSDLFFALHHGLRGGHRFVSGLARFVGVQHIDLLYYLDISGEMLCSTDGSLPELCAAEQRIRDRIEHLPDLRASYAKQRLWDDTWPVGFMAKTAATWRSMQVALAIEAYRNAAGALPDRLDDLVPGDLDAIPEDPYDGAPLRYRRLDVGYVVYAVGRDRKDGHGEERAADGGNRGSDDIVFRVER